MSKSFKLLVLSLFLTQFLFSQNIDSQFLTDEKEIDFNTSKMRGFKIKNYVIIIEKDMQTITFYENGKEKWKRNVIKTCGKPSVGESKIRNIKRYIETLEITYGKHNSVTIERISGKVICNGSD